MLECYTLLGALARETSTVRLSALVTGNTYRNPAVLAKTVTTLDVVSGGRGAARHRCRLVRARARRVRHRVRHLHRPLREARGGAADHRPACCAASTPSLAGKHYQAVDAFNSPPPVSRGPGDDRRRRRAQDAAHGGPVRRRVEPHRRGARPAPQARRPGRALRSSSAATAARSPCRGSAPRASPRRWRRPRPTWPPACASAASTWRRCGDDQRQAMTARFIVGDPDTVGERLAADLALGVDGFTLNAPLNGHVPGPRRAARPHGRRGRRLISRAACAPGRRRA